MEQIENLSLEAGHLQQQKQVLERKNNDLVQELNEANYHLEEQDRYYSAQLDQERDRRRLAESFIETNSQTFVANMVLRQQEEIEELQEQNKRIPKLNAIITQHDIDKNALQYEISNLKELTHASR